MRWKTLFFPQKMIELGMTVAGGDTSKLESLPGIGEVTATKIISNRPYQSIDELVSKKILNKTTFEKNKEVLVTY